MVPNPVNSRGGGHGIPKGSTTGEDFVLLHLKPLSEEQQLKMVSTQIHELKAKAVPP